jgi:hypothetical protein
VCRLRSSQLCGGCAAAIATSNNLVVALLLLLVPAAARHSMPAAWLCFFGLGVAQGPFIVAQNVMTAETVPQGPERPWALMAIRQVSPALYYHERPTPPLVFLTTLASVWLAAWLRRT